MKDNMSDWSMKMLIKCCSSLAYKNNTSRKSLPNLIPSIDVQLSIIVRLTLRLYIAIFIGLQLKLLLNKLLQCSKNVYEAKKGIWIYNQPKIVIKYRGEEFV